MAALYQFKMAFKNIFENKCIRWLSKGVNLYKYCYFKFFYKKLLYAN